MKCVCVSRDRSGRPLVREEATLRSKAYLTVRYLTQVCGAGRPAPSRVPRAIPTRPPDPTSPAPPRIAVSTGPELHKVFRGTAGYGILDFWSSSPRLRFALDVLTEPRSCPLGLTRRRVSCSRREPFSSVGRCELTRSQCGTAFMFSGGELHDRASCCSGLPGSSAAPLELAPD